MASDLHRTDSDSRAEKRALRASCSVRRRALSAAERTSAGAAAAGHVLASRECAESDRVALYAALPDEIPTEELFAALAARGKQLLLPRVEPEGLVFCAAERWADLCPGTLGVLEPPEGSSRIDPGVGDLVLVPGLAFDPEGWRLGRGRGYYDRKFPPGAEGAPLLFGLAYFFQVVAAVPHDSHDRRMDAIVTERGIGRPDHASWRSP